MDFVRGGKRVPIRFSREPSANRILVNVGAAVDVVTRIRDATAVITTFSYIEFAFKAKRETSLDVLHRFFQGEAWGRSQQEMGMVGHDDKRVELETVFDSLILKDVEEESRILFDLEEASAGCSDSGDEVGSEFLWG